MEFDTAGCFLVLTWFTILLMWGCVAKSLGVLLPTLTDQFTTHTWIIGIIASLMGIMSDVEGVLTMLLESHISCRRLLISGSVVFSIGLLVVPFATNTFHIALTLAVLVGPSLGVLAVVGKVMLARHFHEQYTLANGIGRAGLAVSLLALAPLTQLFLDTYGWRGAALFIAGISMHQIPITVTTRVNYTPEYESLKGSSNKEKQDKGGLFSRLKAPFLHLYKAADLRMLLEFKFWTLSMCRFGATCSFEGWMLYYVPHLIVKGFSPQVAANLCAATAVGYATGGIIWAPLTDRGIVKCSTAIIVSSLALSLSFVVDPWVTDIPGCVVVNFVCGLCASALYTLVDVFTRDTFDKDRLVSAFGWVRFWLFPPRLLAGFVPGWIYEARGSYDLAFIVIGLIPTICLLPLIITLMRNKAKSV